MPGKLVLNNCLSTLHGSGLRRTRRWARTCHQLFEAKTGGERSHHPTLENRRARKHRCRKATIGSTLSSKPPGAATPFDWLQLHQNEENAQTTAQKWPPPQAFRKTQSSQMRISQKLLPNSQSMEANIDRSRPVSQFRNRDSIALRPAVDWRHSLHRCRQSATHQVIPKL